MKLKAAFFDRDGVLNVDKSYLYKIGDLEWIDGAKEALAYLTKRVIQFLLLQTRAV